MHVPALIVAIHLQIDQVFRDALPSKLMKTLSEASEDC